MEYTYIKIKKMKPLELAEDLIRWLIIATIHFVYVIWKVHLA